MTFKFKNPDFFKNFLKEKKMYLLPEDFLRRYVHYSETLPASTIEFGPIEK